MLVRGAGRALQGTGLPQPGPGHIADRRTPPNGSRSVRCRFPGGARDFVAFLDAQAGASVHPDVIGFEREDSRIAGTVEVALRWRGSHEERLQGYANSEPTPHGGTHMAGFRDGWQPRSTRTCGNGGSWRKQPPISASTRSATV
nr:hypothetical protein [Streptomyces showdoensis]